MVGKYSRLFLFIAFFSVAMLPGVKALAQDAPSPVTDDDVNQVASQLYCPVCENTPLDVCATTACADWRTEIRDMLEAGRSEEEVKSYFAERYGKRVLAEPNIRGVDILVWLLPPLGVLAGAFLLSRSLRFQPQPDPSAAEAALIDGEFDPADISRVEQELREFMESSS